MNAAISFMHRTRYEWLKWSIAALVWVFMGWLGSEAFHACFGPPIIINDKKPSLVIINNYYIGLVIDRTRTNYCQVHPHHVLLSHILIDGKTEQIIFPLSTPDFVYPKLGEASFVVPIEIPPHLPSGQWAVQTVINDNCNWLSGIFANRMRISQPLSFNIPLEKNEAQ